MEKILYFDYCAFVIDAIVIVALFYRNMTKGRTNQVFILYAIFALITAFFDYGMETLSASAPLNSFTYVLTTVFSYGYLIFRNSMSFMFLLFIVAISRTWYRLGNKLLTAFLALPICVIIFGILSNVFHHSLFIITISGGYERGPLISVLYLLAFVYVVMGILYLIACFKIIDKRELFALMSMYFLMIFASLVQFYRGELLVEMFSISVGMLVILLFVQRPEELVDQENGILNGHNYRKNIKKILANEQPVQIAFIKFVNSIDVRSTIGEARFQRYISLVSDKLVEFFDEDKESYTVYYDVTGCFYLIFDSPKYDLKSKLNQFVSVYESADSFYYEYSVRFITKFSTLSIPDDLSDYNSIITYGRNFPKHMNPKDKMIAAEDIVNTKSFKLDNNMLDILERGIKDHNFEMYYQPIYSLKEQKFVSAEALIRLKDRDYGYVPPGLFIPEAEQSGAIDKIGDFVIESVYKFISTHNLKRLGLDYIEVNLSVEQCLKEHFADYILATQNEYNVRAKRVNFEITETAYNSAKDVLDHNIKKLKARGYEFSLDDYGTGYSNMQRVLNLPIKIVKIDKSLVDELDTERGASIVRNSIKMMHDINLEVVIEGVETEEQLETLIEMDADFIQGYYFSRPLSEIQFIEFLETHNI
ncbi:MAG: EAL domain-containing protein [Lachnospiraceae bacterium]|nr:EAL domain-containing protein [Lachnospiraceae bacterium]